MCFGVRGGLLRRISVLGFRYEGVCGAVHLGGCGLLFSGLRLCMRLSVGGISVVVDSNRGLCVERRFLLLCRYACCGYKERLWGLGFSSWRMGSFAIEGTHGCLAL